MEKSPSWEAKSFSASQEIPRLFMEPEGYFTSARHLPYSETDRSSPCSDIPLPEDPS